MPEALTFVWVLKEGRTFGLFGKNNGAKAGERWRCVRALV